MKGPIDFVIVEFKGATFDGSILKELGDVLEKGIIGLVALSIISKDDSGTVKTVDVADTGDDFLVEFTSSQDLDNSLIDQDDIDETGELLENGTTAAMLVIEHLWAKPLKQAIQDKGGVLVADGRIHPDAQEELNK